jgi:hypothetical protein
MVTFFVAMHHCSKLFAVLQQLFAAKQQIILDIAIISLLSITYKTNRQQKTQKFIELTGFIYKVLAETRGFEPPIRVLAPMLP